VSDRVITVGIVIEVFNKFRLCAVLMFQTVITRPTVITRSLTLELSISISYIPTNASKSKSIINSSFSPNLTS
jgi:hypothetical protein